ncbi:hypothetical protein IEQ34_001929 [Dendrobium chrysotoxum]|uniref:Uncharacterized protein n=1 Tax=Dendrobium chrysotoxum TaxID=161865 RepID=A0AAV7HJX6_DENCH|nr:hypothetical protein IEQ34_001929 [Dendrobium chrysotoxum]
MVVTMVKPRLFKLKDLEGKMLPQAYNAKNFHKYLKRKTSSLYHCESLISQQFGAFCGKHSQHTSLMANNQSLN